jgi:hypothetical protein
MTNTQHLRIIVTKCEGMLVAQCLEFDVCTQGRDLETLQSRMNCLLAVEIDDAQAIDPAPERFHNLWEQAIEKLDGDHEYRMLAA